MIKRFLRAIAERILRREMLALHHYRVHLQEYEQWFASEDDIVRVLRNLRGQCEPEGLKGTTGISALRDAVRRQREMQRKLHAALDHIIDNSDKRRDAEAVDCDCDAAKNNKVN